MIEPTTSRPLRRYRDNCCCRCELYSNAYDQALIRDAKAHIEANGFPNLPVGAFYYETAFGEGGEHTVKELQHSTGKELDYFACGEVPADFFVWHIGHTNCPSQQWISEQAEQFSDTNMPILLTSEPLCTNRADEYKVFHALYNRSIADVLSGGYFYDYERKPPVSDFPLRTDKFEIPTTLCLVLSFTRSTFPIDTFPR